MTKNFWLLAGALAAVGCGGDKSIYDQFGNAASDGGRSRRDGGTGGGKDDDVCGKHSVTSDHAVPDMLIVLDRSASMGRDGNENRTDRWGGSAQAVSQLVTRYSMGVNFGLMTFPGGGQRGSQFNQAACTPGAVDVEIGEDKGAAINQAISRMGPGGYTPTASTLEAALQVIGSPEVSDQKVTPSKFVLLVTDGDPNCSANFRPNGGNNEDPQGRMETIAAIEKLTDAGVKTYVVGYETAASSFAGQLDLMAAAGGTGESTHRSVASAEDLAATFEELAAYATSCSFRLSKTVDPVFVAVTVGGKMRNYQNEADGWRLEGDERTVSLLGKACTDAKNGGAFTVDVECTPVIGY
ncbi:MAG: vWA domain-containing protein [Polyangiales bacterium]